MEAMRDKLSRADFWKLTIEQKHIMTASGFCSPADTDAVVADVERILEVKRKPRSKK